MAYVIDITAVLSVDLKSRSTVHDLMLYVQNSGEKEVEIDFAKVQFATRSFVDEYYNVFMKSPIEGLTVQTVNMPDEISEMFDIVKGTQKNATKTAKFINTNIFHTIQEFCDYCSKLAF